MLTYHYKHHRANTIGTNAINHKFPTLSQFYFAKSGRNNYMKTTVGSKI